MKILVTGAAGFIGSNTVDFLIEHGHEVLVVDNFSTGRLENLSRSPSVDAVDIRDTERLNGLFRAFHPEAVLHLAANSAITTAWKNPQEDLSVNALGTLNMIELSLRFGVSKFVFSSTAAVYGKSDRWWNQGGGDGISHETDKPNPGTPYGISKLAAENYIRLMFPNHVILRFANIYGPRQQPIGDNQLIARAFRHFIHGDEFKIVGDGNQKRDFVYVGDLCNAIFSSLTENVTGTFNVASGHSHSVNEVLAEIEKVYSVTGYKWEHTPEQDERGSVYMNSSLIRNRLGWKPHTPLEQGIRLTALDWEAR